ncbi:MAG: hypothetical protein EBT95_05585 [Verrucomicrobia bacterium]|nr:hypothetical protein [Verrucomicrobiota bacterium]
MARNSTASQQFKEKFFLTWFKKPALETKQQQLLLLLISSILFLLQKAKFVLMLCLSQTRL